MKQIELYTDGGCAPTNPGPGACAYAIVIDNELQKHSIFTSPDSTSNIMELTAIIKGLTKCKELYDQQHIQVYTDSQYVEQGLNTWSENWKKNGWKNGKGKPIANQALWFELLALRDSMNITCTWVKAHNGNPWNEFVDKLCSYKEC